jgi:hypothetical protein
MAVTGNTQLLQTKADLISALVQKELAFQAKLLPTITDVSVFAVKGAKSVSFPKFTSFTVENRASATAGTIQDLTSTKDQLDLNIRAYVSWLVDSTDEIQSSVDVQAEYIKRASAAHARYLDTQIIAVLEANAGFDVGATPITQGLILDAREELVKNHADLNALTMLIGPDSEKVMLSIADFVRADAYGNSNLPSGTIGKVYGMPVVVHAGVAAGKAYWYEKSGCAIAFQKSPQYDEQKEISYGTGAMLAAVDQLFGVKALQLGQLGKGATESPLIVKM